jgi:peptidoglycan/LPS O-acetylase OafA/YrhL
MSVRGRRNSLDGLRGWAAVSVAFYHAILHNDLSLIDRVLYQPIQVQSSLSDILSKVVLTVLNGELAVFLFFVLSGAVLRLSLDSKSDRPLPRVFVAFAAARIARLYPPLIACLILFFFLSRIGIVGFPRFDLSQLVLNSTLLKITMHGPSATIQAEIMAVPFILIAWRISVKLGLVGSLLCVAYAVLAVDSGAMVLKLPMMNAYLVAFMGGMLVSAPVFNAAFQQVPDFAWPTCVVALIFCRMFHYHASLMSLLAMVLIASVFVGGLLHGYGGKVAKICNNKISQKLGTVSYSFYLYNVVVLHLIWSLTDRFTLPQEFPVSIGLLIGSLSVLTTYPLAKLSEYCIERPSISLARWLSFAVLDRSVLPRDLPNSQG